MQYAILPMKLFLTSTQYPNVIFLKHLNCSMSELRLHVIRRRKELTSACLAVSRTPLNGLEISAFNLRTTEAYSGDSAMVFAASQLGA